MSCGECIYWMGNTSSWSNEIQKANCTRYPKWEETDNKHFCGEMKAALCGFSKERAPRGTIFTKAFRKANADMQKVEKEKEILRAQIKKLRLLYKEKTGKSVDLKKLDQKKPNKSKLKDINGPEPLII